MDPVSPIRLRALSLRVLVLATSLLLLSCASHGPLPVQKSTIAVIGVSTRDGLDSGMNRALMARELAEMLTEKGIYSVVATARVHNAVGSKRYQELLDTHARNGRFSDAQLQMLMAAGIPARRAIIARVEDDTVRSLEPARESIANRLGGVMSDRERVVLATERDTRLSATLLDLRTGHTVWERAYRVKPVTRSAYTHYFGSSFSGSLAAAFANTVVNGIRVPDHPPPPSIRLTLRSLMREVGRNLPVR